MKKYQFICPQCGNTFETDSLVTIHSNRFWRLCKFCQDKYKRTVFNKQTNNIEGKFTRNNCVNYKNETKIRRTFK